MKRRNFCLILVVLLTFLSFYHAWSLEKHSNGWIWPTGGKPSEKTLNTWHSYATHVGIDIPQKANKPVYAIADGKIADWNNNLPYYGDRRGSKGGAVLLEHIAIDKNGKKVIFYAVYGHNYIVEKLKKKGKEVKAGDIIAYTHPYYDYSGDMKIRADHLHFGIRPDEMEGNGKQFRGFSSDGKDHGWVNPKTFLNTHYPANYLSYFYISEGNLHLAWSPSNVPCDKARIWAYNQTCSAENSHPGICSTFYDQLSQQSDLDCTLEQYHKMLFGTIEEFQQFLP